MRRRRILQLAGPAALAVAGCLDDGASTTDTTSGSTSTPEADYPSLSVSSSSPPPASDVETGVELLEGFTAASPAAVRVAFTNTASTERAFWFGTVVPFTPGPIRHADEAARLQLVPESGAGVVDTNEDGELQAVPDRPTDGCWQAPDEILLTDELNQARLDPDETATERFTVVAHPGNEGCLPDGPYRTVSSWYAADEDGNQDTAHEWEITLTVSP